MTMTVERSQEAALRTMIDTQLRPSGVNQPWLLAAIARLPREGFVPEGARAAAYIDRAVPLGDGRWLAAPLVHARMVAEAEPQRGDEVLLVGDGEGYLAALLRPMVGSLDAVSPDKAQTHRLRGNYTLIVIDGAVEHLPDTLVGQMAPNGRLVCGLVERGVTRLAIGRVSAGAIAMLPLAEIGIPVLTEFSAPKRWSF